MGSQVSWYGLWAALLVGGTIGGCKCSRDVAVEPDRQIDRPSIVQLDPDAPRPDVDFPPELHLDDPSFNRFVVHALEVCRQGDYDGFRQLFGTAYEPTTHDNFRKVWGNVKSIQVRRVVKGPQETPHYYLYGRIRLREPDRKGQDRRDIWVMVFRETDQWRLGAPSQDIVDRLRMLETSPATEANP